MPFKGAPNPALNGRTLPFEKALQKQAVIADRELRDSEVWPTMQQPLHPEKNFIYCATQQIALQRYSSQTGKGVAVVAGGSPLALAIAADRFNESNLDPSSYLAEAGPNTDETDSRIRKAIAERFAGLNVPYKRPSPESPTYTFCFLQKSLPFATVFDVYRDRFLFHHAGRATAVDAFGCYTADAKTTRPLIRIVSYASPDDFVVTLMPDSPTGDRIILAKTAPRSTLAETWKPVAASLSKPFVGVESQLDEKEKLIVPKISFGTLRIYPELTGPGRELASAQQGIRFHLDERGAFLESFSAGAAGNGHPPGSRSFEFDKPFLLALIEAKADQPYLVLWIGNTELLMPKGER